MEGRTLSRFVEAWKVRLASPRIAIVAPLLALALTAPAMLGGLHTDDHLHRVSLTTSDPVTARDPWDIFSLAPAPGAPLGAVVDAGVLPWWTPEGANLRLWRPLASLSHWVDWRALKAPVWAMHLENLLWYAALVVIVGALYRRLLTPSAVEGAEGAGLGAGIRAWPAWVAGMAGLFYAIDDAHGVAAGWIANRNAVMAAVFGFGALLAYERWRREAWRPGLAWALAGLSAALLSAEVAISILGYMAAHALFMDRGSRRSRLVALAPFVGLGVVWQVVYRGLGYGNRGSGLFLDPIDAPLGFAVEAPSRASALVFGQWGWVPSDLWVAVPEGEGHLAVMVGAAVFGALILGACRPLLARDSAARFFMVGSLLSMAPICATFPMDRLLLFVGFGAMGTIAQVIGAAAEPPVWMEPGPRWRRRARTLGISWVIIHGGLAPLLLPLRTMTPELLAPSFERLSEALPDDIEGKELVVVSAPDFWSAGLTPVVRRSQGRPSPERVRVLSAGLEGLIVERVAVDAVALRRAEGVFSDPMARLFQGERRGGRAGESVSLSGVVIEVEAVNEASRPSSVVYRFEGALEGEGRVWVIWRGGGYARFELPGVGERVEVPAMAVEAIFAPRGEP